MKLVNYIGMALGITAMALGWIWFGWEAAPFNVSYNKQNLMQLFIIACVIKCKNMELSNYYVSCAGKLCITFNHPPSKPELCEVIGLQNETWFKHLEIL